MNGYIFIYNNHRRHSAGINLYVNKNCQILMLPEIIPHTCWTCDKMIYTRPPKYSNTQKHLGTQYNYVKAYVLSRMRRLHTCAYKWLVVSRCEVKKSKQILRRTPFQCLINVLYINCCGCAKISVEQQRPISALCKWKALRASKKQFDYFSAWFSSSGDLKFQ